MPSWLAIVIGLVSGGGTIVGAIYLAFRPDLAVEPPKARVAGPTQEASGEMVTGARAASQGLLGPNIG